MLQDSLTYNLNQLPGEKASFFKTLVRSQDEVPEAFKKSFFVGNIKDNYPQFYINQADAISDTSYCASVFYTGQKQITEISPKEISNKQTDSYFYLLLFCLVMGTVILVIKHKRISQIFKAFYLPHFTNQLMREGMIQREFYAFPLLLIYYVSLSLLIAKSLNFFYEIPTDFYFVLGILGMFIIFFIARSLMVNLIKWTFRTYNETSAYNTNHFVFSIITGMFLTPMVFIIYYIQDPGSYILLGVVLIITLLLFLYRITRSFLIGLTHEGYRWYYFILYLCTIEILPIVITVKLLINLYLKGFLIV